MGKEYPALFAHCCKLQKSGHNPPMDDFAKCNTCGAIIDTHHDPMADGVCLTCTPKPVSTFPLPDHMKKTLEPYIQWRCDQAVAQTYLKVYEHQDALQKMAYESKR